MPDHAQLQLDVWPQRGALVVRPRGELSLESYAPLRDCLLKCMAEQPAAVLVELGQLRVQSPALLSVFVSVWMRCSAWTNVPLVLAATREPVRSMLARSAVPRFIATCPTLAQAWLSVERPPPRRRPQFSVSPSPAGGRRAREFVRNVCYRWHLERLCDDAILVAAALVDNAIEDGCLPRRLNVELRSTGLAIAVRGSEPSRRDPSTGPFDHEGSRGLAIVARICSVWGRWPTTDGGEVTWAVLSLRGDRR